MSTSATAPARRGLIHYTLATFGTNVGVAGLSFLNVLIIARSLGPSGRGEFAFLVAMANLTHYLATLGIQEANINLAGRDASLRRSLATNSVLASLVLGVAAAFAVEKLVAVFPAVGGGSSPVWRAIALGSVPFLILQNYMTRLIQADSRFTLTNLAWLLGPLVNVVGNGALAATGLITVGTAVATWIAGQVGATLVLVGFYVLRSAGFGRPDWRLARAALHFGLRSHAGTVMMVGNYRLDQWILGATRSASELGIYSVAVAMAETLFYLPEAVKTVVRPRLVRADQRRAVLESGVYFRTTFLITGVGAGILIAFAPQLIQALFGSGFAASAPQLRILAFGALGIVALKVLGNTLTAQRKPGLESIAGGAAFVMTVGLDVLLIPRFGGIGAASASTAAYVFGGVTVAVVYVRSLDAGARDLLPQWADLRRLVALGRSGEEGA